MVEERENILYGNSIMGLRSNQNSPSKVHMRSSSRDYTNIDMNLSQPTTQRDSKYNYTSKLSQTQTRYSDTMKNVENNVLSRSRVSSKKREEIVQKATSEARLRIQEIENRALKRIGKIDS